MKNKLMKGFSLVLASSLLMTNVAYAKDLNVRKNETIYVTKEADKIKDKTGSIWINSDNNIKVKDKTNLKEIKNLKTDKKVNLDNGYINWNEDSKDIYYQGKTNEDLPVDINVKYFLDGKEMTFDKLKGKSGHLKIQIEAVNKKKTKAKIDGKDKEIYSPYLALAEINFNSDKVKNLTTKDGKIVKDGKNEILAAILTPGLKENFQGIIEADKLDNFKDKVEMEMDVKDYEPTEVYALITNEFFQEDAKLDSLDELKNGINELEENAAKLVDGSNKLDEGSKKLNDGIGKLNEGAGQLSQGSNKIVSSFDQLSSAFSSLPGKIQTVNSAVNQLNNGGSKLYTGVNQYTMAVGQINNN
ncbi:MAG: hypothetical protein ACLU05_09590, partial [Anaerococcus obesiensis]